MKQSFRHRQVRTAVLLALITICCTVVGLYVRKSAAVETVASTAIIGQDDINDALMRYRNRTEHDAAQLILQPQRADALKVELALYGACSAQTAKKLVELLSESDAGASYYLTASEVAPQADAVAILQQAGYSIGVLNDGSSADAPFVSGEAAVASLSRASLTMQAACGLQPVSMLVFSTPPQELLSAAKVAYIDAVYVAEQTAALGDIATQKDADALIGGIRRGGILALKMTGDDRRTLDAMERILVALKQTDLSAAVEEQLALSATESMPDAIKIVRTTQRAVCFTFSGTGSAEELDAVLSALNGVSAKATFFVTDSEAIEEKETIQRILEAGHSLGVAILPQGASAAELLRQLLQTEETIRTVYQYTAALPVRTVSGSASQELLRAASAGGFTVLSAGLNVAQQQDMRETDAASVLMRVMPENRGALQRGEIVHFRLGLFQASRTLLGELVSLVARERNVYPVLPLADVLDNPEYTYTYPVPEDEILPEVKDRIHPGQLLQDNSTELIRRYYGISWVDRASFLPGFSEDEVRKLDKRGVIVNNDNMVFLTFDDWGTDATITGLLDVLRRHNAKATFFVRTSYVEANPNLLRAIALEGHAVGSHTDSHFPLSNETKNALWYTEITDEQAAALQKDLMTSYDKLQSIIGDVSVDGKPALCRIFRPPTLAMSRKGLKTVLDCGFTYSVSGSYTSQDYNATNASVLANTLVQNTRSGSVIVMHMSDNSIHTAEALELYFTKLERRTGTNAQYRFCRLTDALPDDA